MTRFGRRSALLVAAVGVVAAMWTATPAARAATPSPSFVPLTPGAGVGHAVQVPAGRRRRRHGRSVRTVCARQGRCSRQPAVSAVALNVTATDGIDPDCGWRLCHRLSVWYSSRRVEPQLRRRSDGAQRWSIAPVSPTGTVCFYVYGAAHLLADVSGYFPTGSDFTSVTPARVLDTRTAARSATPPARAHPRADDLGKGGLPDDRRRCGGVERHGRRGREPRRGWWLRHRVSVWHATGCVEHQLRGRSDRSERW